MSKQVVFRDRFEDTGYMEKFNRVLESSGRVHMSVVQWVKDQEILTDDSAIHAAAFSIRKDVEGVLNSPHLVFYEPDEDPSINLRNLRLYEQVRPESRLVLFGRLVAEIAAGDLVVDDVWAVLRKFPGFDRDAFGKVLNYAQLASAVLEANDGHADIAAQYFAKATGESFAEMAND